MGQESKKDLVLNLASTVTFISTYYLVMPAIPIYLMDMHVNKLLIGILLSIFSTVSFFSRIFGGSLINKLGSKKLMLFSILLCFINPVIIELASPTLGIGLAQVVFGLTVGSFTVASAAHMSNIASKKNLAQLMGLNSIAFVIAKGLAPAAGIKLIYIWDFKMLILLILGIALLAVILTVPLSETGVNTAQETPEKSPGFFKVIKNRDVYMLAGVLFFGMVTFGAITTMLPIFAEERGIAGIEYFFVVNTLVTIVARFISGFWRGQDFGPLVSSALVMLVLSFLLMSFVHSLAFALMVSVVYGFGMAIFFPYLTSTLILRVPDHFRGLALGIFTSAFDLGVGAGSILGGLSEFINFDTLYLLMAVFPLIGLIMYRRYLRCQVLEVPNI